MSEQYVCGCGAKGSDYHYGNIPGGRFVVLVFMREVTGEGAPVYRPFCKEPLGSCSHNPEKPKAEPKGNAA